MYNAELIAVGTELLLGSIANTDGQMLAKELSALGIGVYYQTVVGDNPKRLAGAVELAKSRADILITTGGLGPTCDDLTKNVLADCFGLKLVSHHESEDRIRSYFAGIGRTMTENNLRQAMLPEDCTVLKNDWGTAPGCAFSAQGKHVLMLPGPPRECGPMFRIYGIPYLHAQGLTEGQIISRTLKLFGIGESAMEARLPAELVDCPNPTLAPYAKFGETELRITARCASQEEGAALIAPVEAQLRDIFGSLIYGVNVTSLEEAVSRLLRQRGLTLSAAESCTGGLLSKRMTDLPGATDVFRGGVVCYTNDLKADVLGVSRKTLRQFGPVSSQCARELAEGCRQLCGSDLAIAITGLAGAAGDDFGTPGGRVYIALADGRDCQVKTCDFGHERERVRQMAAHTGLDMVRRWLD